MGQRGYFGQQCPCALFCSMSLANLAYNDLDTDKADQLGSVARRTLNVHGLNGAIEPLSIVRFSWSTLFFRLSQSI